MLLFSPILKAALFIVSFIVHKFLSLIRSHLFIFAFISITLRGGSLKLRESILKWVDKKSRVPEEKKVVQGSQGGKGLEFSRRKGQTFFPLHSLVLVRII